MANYTDKEIVALQNVAQVKALLSMADTFEVGGAPVPTEDSLRTIHAVVNSIRACAKLLRATGGLVDG